MNEIKKIKQNSIYSLLSISSRLIANVFIFLLIPRFYDPESFGQFTFAHTLSTTLIILADFGFDVLLTLEISRNNEDAPRIFQLFFTLKTLFSFSAMVVMWLLAFILEVSSTSKDMIIIFSFFLVFTTLTNFLYALYKGFEKFEYETHVSLIMNICLLVLSVVLIFMKVSIIVLAIAFALSRIIGFIFGIAFSKKVLHGIKYFPLFEGFLNIKNNMLIFGFHLFFSYLFFQLDTILLALWKGEYYVGIYQSAFKLIMLPLIIPEILLNVLLPVLSRMNKDNIERWKMVGSYMNKILLILILPVSILLFIYSSKLINLIYGNKYNEAIPVLQIFSIIIFVRFSLETYALMLTTSNRQKIRLYAVIAATLLNFALNYFLIPTHGVFGAAIVSLITNTFVGISYFAAQYSLFKEWTFNSKNLLLFGISVVIFLGLFELTSISFLLGIPLTLIIYSVIGSQFYFSSSEKKILLSDFSISGLFFKKF